MTVEETMYSINQSNIPANLHNQLLTILAGMCANGPTINNCRTLNKNDTLRTRQIHFRRIRDEITKPSMADEKQN